MKGIIPYKVCVIRNKRTAEGRWCWTVASAKCIDLWWWTPWRRSSCLHAHLLSQWSERGFFHVIVNVQNEKHSTYGAKSFSQQGCGGWVGFIPLWPSSVLVWLHSFGSGKQNMPAFWPFRVWSSPLKKFTPSTSRRPLSLVTLSCITLLTGSHGGGAGEHCTRGGLVFWKRG